ncbi:MAG: hypothetical protein CMM16_01585 [Rhodospirillaceae bacterium]|nr:hypothetical protein [Rhodospirillaceae bacterium]
MGDIALDKRFRREERLITAKTPDVLVFYFENTVGQNAFTIGRLISKFQASSQMMNIFSSPEQAICRRYSR